MPIPSPIPHLIPDTGGIALAPPLPSAPTFSLYDLAIGGVPFVYASGQDGGPSLRQTAPFEKQRIDQAESAGEQTLTGWWVKSQDSFHGGAGQLQLEPAVPTPLSHVRFDLCKNVDVFTPGRVTRLPDTVVVKVGTCRQMVSVMVTGSEAIVYIDGSGNVQKLTALDGAPVTAQFVGAGVANATSLATDGTFVYVATNTGVYKLTPSNVSLVTLLATYPSSATDAVVGWQKARVVLGVAGSVYAGFENQAAHPLVADGTDPYFLYKHPTAGFVWRCFASSPTAILAAGDAMGQSIILQFDTTTVSGVPTLQADGQIGDLPVGERVLSMQQTMGTYLGIGTTRGFRVGSFDSYFSRLTYGPLQLLPTDPTIPCNVVLARDRFFFAVGSDYDEGGLQAIDLGSKIDDAGRFAWSPHLVTPTATATAATAGCVLPSSARLAFYVAGTGIVLEGTTAGTVRSSWLRTSRIRYDTTEPKFFKLGRIRGDLTTGEVEITGITADGPTVLGTRGRTTIDPNEFNLPSGAQGWLQLMLNLTGAATVFSSYQVKALPGTRRERHIQPVLSLYDDETLRNGVGKKSRLSSRQRLERLEALDAIGDTVLLQEYTPNGVVSTLVVIEQVKYQQGTRVTQTSDVGGVVTVLMRTVE